MTTPTLKQDVTNCPLCGAKYKIKSQGYNYELEREEIQIHAGDNGNVFLLD
jgi:hypothetical protein